MKICKIASYPCTPAIRVGALHKQLLEPSITTLQKRSHQRGVLLRADLFTGDNVKTAITLAGFVGGPAFFLNQFNTKLEAYSSALDKKFEKFRSDSEKKT